MSDNPVVNEAGAKLYLEDLKPGMKFRSRQFLLTAEAIKEFAEQWDPQPFHTDEVAAENTFFKGLAASGWHTAAITMRLNTETLPIAGGLIGAGLDGLRWFKPVRPGESLWLEVEILSVRASNSKPWQGLAQVKHVTYNQDNEPVQEFTSTIVVPKRDK